MIIWRPSKQYGTAEKKDREGRKLQRIANSATRPKEDENVCQPFFSKSGWSSNKQFAKHLERQRQIM
jgi:hypothetical protein